MDQEQKSHERSFITELFPLDQEQKPRQHSFITELVPDWRPTREQALWAVRITIVLVVLLGILTLIGLPFGITLWEWVKLLIVPAVIAAGGLWFNQQQKRRELQIADQRAQDEALQAYLDQMSQLLTDKDRPLRRAQPGDNLSAVAWARTLTVLTRLDGRRRGSVVQFLSESGLINWNRRILSLSGADLREADLSIANLKFADLQHTHLGSANLYGAGLSMANLRGANLRGANLRWADLSMANLSMANLSNTYLRDANLTLTNLSGAQGASEKRLAECESLKGATLPNGQKYEEWLIDKGSRGEYLTDDEKAYLDWLKDREGRGDDGENSSPS